MPHEMALGPAELDFAPADETAEILQNVRMIVATPRGSVPLDRDFGVAWDFLDLPAPSAQAAVSSEIVRQVARYEPRARITRVRWEGATDTAAEGRLFPRVWLEITPRGV